MEFDLTEVNMYFNLIEQILLSKDNFDSFKELKDKFLTTNEDEDIRFLFQNIEDNFTS